MINDFYKGDPGDFDKWRSYGMYMLGSARELIGMRNQMDGPEGHERWDCWCAEWINKYDHWDGLR